MSDIEINGKQIRNPFLIAGITLLVVVAFAVMLVLGSTFICFFAYLVTMIMVSVVISLPIHFVMRLMGREGFLSRARNGSLRWKISSRSFRRRK
ncbi:MAG: hypothetical protein WCI52_01970 [bacterium]